MQGLTAYIEVRCACPKCGDFNVGLLPEDHDPAEKTHTCRCGRDAYVRHSINAWTRNPVPFVSGIIPAFASETALIWLQGRKAIGNRGAVGRPKRSKKLPSRWSEDDNTKP